MATENTLCTHSRNLAIHLGVATLADLFLSYARSDRASAAKLIAILEQQGYSTWWDHGLQSGASFAREIQLQIDEAKVVLVIWSQAAAGSDWVLAEAQRGHARRKLLCTRIDAFPTDEIPLPYNALHCAEADDVPALILTLRQRGVQPSHPQRRWEFYAEPIEVRRKACDRLRQIKQSYGDLSGGATPPLDPSMDVRLEHTTKYTYDRPIVIEPQCLRIYPTLDFTRFRSYSLKFGITPDTDERFHDLFTNVVRRVGYHEKQTYFGFVMSMITNLTPFNPFSYPIDDAFFKPPFQYSDIELALLGPYLELEMHDDVFVAFSKSAMPSLGSHPDFIVSLMKYVHQHITNVFDETKVTGQVRPLREIILSGHGTCGEQSTVLVNLLRYHGLAARYVSGYLLDFVGAASNPGVDGPWCADYGAWAQTYVSGSGWVGVDAMTELLPQENFIPLACGSRLADTHIVQGMVEWSRIDLSVQSKVTPVSRSLAFD